MQLLANTAFAKEHDSQESRFEEERSQHLERDQRPDDGARDLRELREREPELEREDDPGDDADREAHREDVQPEPVDLLVYRIACLEPQALHNREKKREADRDG